MLHPSFSHRLPPRFVETKFVVLVHGNCSMLWLLSSNKALLPCSMFNSEGFLPIISSGEVKPKSLKKDWFAPKNLSFRIKPI